MKYFIAIKEDPMLKKLLPLCLAAFAFGSVARADSIDNLLANIKAEQDAKVRLQNLFDAGSSVGVVRPATPWNLQYSNIDTSGKDPMSGITWHNVITKGQSAERGADGSRRRATAIVIRNNPLQTNVDGPFVRLEQFWIRSTDRADGEATPVRLKALENKQVDLSSIPNISFVGEALESLQQNLNVIAHFYQTYDMRDEETRVVFLKERMFVDAVQIRAITLDNVSNYSGHVEVRVIYE
jgi:hypothetical protein